MGREIQQFLVEILGSECAFLIVLGGTEESIIRYDAKPQTSQYTFEMMRVLGNRQLHYLTIAQN